MAYSIDTINLICSDMGAPANHKYEINGLNAICVALGGVGKWDYHKSALNEICALMGKTATFKYTIDSLNALAGSVSKYEDEAWAKIREASGVGIPAYSLADIWLDGTIIDVEGSKYFVDKKGGANVLITGYDFPTGWTKGFPYKSAATIDIFGQTAVPVVSLFQNFDYADQYFCKHIAQVVDVNGVEVSEPYVSAIVAYSAPLTGADLTSANTYFNVPVEVTTAVRWIDPVSGIDTNAGTKAAPWKTATKANTSATELDTIYIKSGIIGGNALVTAKNLIYIGIGLAEMRSTSPNQVIYANTTGSTFKGIILNGENGRTWGLRIETTTAKTIILNRCLIKNITQLVIGGGGSESISLINSVFIGAINSVYSSQDITISSPLIDTCLFKNTKITLSIIGNTLKNNVFLENDKGSCVDATGIAISAYGNKLSFKVYGIKSAADYTVQKTIEINNNTFTQIGVSGVGYSAIRFVGTVNMSVKYNSFYSDYVYTNEAYFIYSRAGAGYTNEIERNLFNSPNTAPITHIFATGIGTKIRYNRCKTNALSGSTITLGYESSLDSLNDNSIVSGNVIEGFKVSYPNSAASTHAMLINNGINIEVSYNKIRHSCLGIVVKAGSGLAYTSKGVMYNLVEDCQKSIWTRGITGLNVFNNTLTHSNTVYSNQFDNFIFCDENTANAGDQFSENIIFKNNILKTQLTTGALIQFDTHAALTCKAENNHLDGGQYLLSDGTNYSDLATAQAENKLLNCVVGDPLLSAALIPETPITGADLGTDYNDGLDVTSTFGSETNTPVIVTKEQAATWQKGAFIQ